MTIGGLTSDLTTSEFVCFTAPFSNFTSCFTSFLMWPLLLFNAALESEDLELDLLLLDFKIFWRFSATIAAAFLRSLCAYDKWYLRALRSRNFLAQSGLGHSINLDVGDNVS